MKDAAYNIAKLFDIALRDEQVEGVVFGPYDDDGYNFGNRWIQWPDGAPDNFGVVLPTWEQARPYLDVEASATDVPSVLVWTTGLVFFVHVYDSYSVSVHSVPRNPIACTPQIVGG